VPNYRADVWFQYSEDGCEDLLEEKLRDLMNLNQMRVQGGPVVFRMQLNGEPIWDDPHVAVASSVSSSMRV
jgi:hypothetical protein